MATLPTPQPTHQYSLMAVKLVMRLGPKCTTLSILPSTKTFIECTEYEQQRWRFFRAKL